MTEVLLREHEVAALASALEALGSTRVRLDALWRCWAAAAPRFAGTTGQVAAMAAALRELEDRGMVDLPKGAWDRSTTPPLPRFLTVVSARRPPRARRWTSYPWRSELGWVASLPSVSDELFMNFVAINEWVSRNTGRTVSPVPIRYRSAELFDDEKRLEKLLRSTAICGPYRLNSDLLAFERIPAPIAAVQVGVGADALVVETPTPIGSRLGRSSARSYPIRLGWLSGAKETRSPPGWKCLRSMLPAKGRSPETSGTGETWIRQGWQSRYGPAPPRARRVYLLSGRPIRSGRPWRNGPCNTPVPATGRLRRGEIGWAQSCGRSLRPCGSRPAGLLRKRCRPRCSPNG